MPTIVSHPAIALLKTWFRDVPPRAVIFGVIGSVLPDADVAAFVFGIPYNHLLGHRGLSHSIAFAVVYALIATAFVRAPRVRVATFCFLFLCTMSHALFDAFTNGGLGVAFFAPFSNERYFFPWQPIEVSPIGAGFFSRRGLAVLLSEGKWLWLPLLATSALGVIVAKRRRIR